MAWWALAYPLTQCMLGLWTSIALWQWVAFTRAPHAYAVAWGWLPECQSTGVWPWSRDTMLDAAHRQVWRFARARGLCVEPQHSWWWLVIPPLCLILGYTGARCVRYGVLAVWFEGVRTLHPKADTKRKLSGVKCPPRVATNPANPHAAGAAIRLQVHKFVHAICAAWDTGATVVRYDLSYAKRDEMFGTSVLGRRWLRSAQDLSQPVRDDPRPIGVPVSAIDTAYYLRPYDWDEFCGELIVFNAQLPTAIAWKESWTTAYFDAQSVLHEQIAGGKTYTHPLPEPGLHELFLHTRGWFWNQRVVCYEQTVVRVPDSRQAIFIWTPQYTITAPWWAFCAMYRFMTGSVPPRPRNWEGAVRVESSAGDRKVSVVQMVTPDGKISARLESTIDGRAFELDRTFVETVALRGAVHGSPVSIHDTSSMANRMEGVSTDPAAVTMSAVVAGAGVLPVTTTPVGYVPGAGVETAGARVPTKEEGIAGLVNPPASVAAHTPAAVAAVLGRVEQLQVAVPRTISPALKSELMAAARYLGGLIGPMDPKSREFVLESMTKPAQRARNAKLPQQDVAVMPDAKPSTMQKTEATPKPNPRVINIVETDFNVEYGRFTKAFYAGLKKLPMCGSGVDATALAAKIADSTVAGLLDSIDIADMDASQGTTARVDIYEEVMRTVFAAHLQELEPLLLAARTGKLTYRSRVDDAEKMVAVVSDPNVSGCSDTTNVNTIIMIVVALVAAQRTDGGYDTHPCGLFSGDDGLVPKRIRSAFDAVMAELGFTVKVEDLASPEAVKFLNQIFVSPSTTRTSTPSMHRLLSKLCVITTANAGLLEKIMGLNISYPRNPIVQAVTRAYTNAYGLAGADMQRERARLKKRPTYELAAKQEAGAFLYDSKDEAAVYREIAHEAGKDTAWVRAWVKELGKVRTQDDLLKVGFLRDDGSEVDGKYPITRVAYPAVPGKGKRPGSS
ncbi:hypothetical protein 1 [Hubei unio douglasiae virus 3]|uniref:hypothetical protein 1 n=1 Tax=Hubei unio douglasiae virus 3 TaxID=1923323 RepID=UPI000909DEF8|nr:hypothetical protein 1 [Hubei unio douglasiae virus 3]APG76517.1 hypothetical protein 1 [Hubei unio douglasiae virus 3]